MPIKETSINMVIFSSNKLRYANDNCTKKDKDWQMYKLM